MVMILSSSFLISLIAAYSVVVLPEPVGPGDEHHAVRFVNVPAKLRHFVGIEAHHVQRQVAEFFAQRLLVEDAEHGVFAVDRRHDRNAKIDEAALVANAEAAVLRDATLGDIELAHHLDARKDGRMPVFGEGLHRVLQDAVDAVLHHHFGIARFDVDVARAALEGREDHGVHQANDGAHACVARVSFSIVMFSSLSSSSLTT